MSKCDAGWHSPSGRPWTAPERTASDTDKPVLRRWYRRGVSLTLAQRLAELGDQVQQRWGAVELLAHEAAPQARHRGWHIAGHLEGAYRASCLFRLFCCAAAQTPGAACRRCA
ncbi:hypothetical protein SALBM135S_05604 [Streptomyces alboniger]